MVLVAGSPGEDSFAAVDSLVAGSLVEGILVEGILAADIVEGGKADLNNHK